MNKNCYILDGYSIIYRSYFAFIRNPLFSPDGRNTSAVFGFFRTVFSIINQYKPETFFIAMDSIGPTFRHEQYPEYKQNRQKTPDDLRAQIPIIEEILEALGIPIIRCNGFEADDIMATVSDLCNKQGIPCYIISGDKDLLQLVKKSSTVLKPDKSGYQLMTPDLVFEDKGVYPEQINDYLALVGDSADNIPGVAGIGPKTAAKLLLDYNNLEKIYENIDSIKAAGQRKKLGENKENAFLSKDLAALRYDVPLEVDVFTTPLAEPNIKEASSLFHKEGIRSIPGITIPGIPVKGLGDELSSGGQQPSLFDEPAQKIETPKEAPPSSIEAEYQAVVTEEDLVKWMNLAKTAEIFAFDIETNNLDAMLATPVGFSLSVESGKACYIPLKAAEASCLSESLVKEAIRDLLSDSSLKMIAQNGKYDVKVLEQWGIPVQCFWFDTMIAAWLLDSARNSYSMDNLAADMLHYQTLHFKDIVPKDGLFSDVPLDKAVFYAAEDADITFRLYEILAKELKERELEKLFFDIEMPIVPILSGMEQTGISLDGKSLKEYSREMDRELAGLEDEIYILCGKQFNIKSPKQIQQVLFEERKLTPIKKTRTGYSTDISVLTVLAKEDPVPEKILRHRLLSKLKSTYVDALPELINPKTKKIHSHFIQTGTATGRISSQNPNMQNIPIREKEGRRIRFAFKACPGNVLISADYSQIELVVLAHLSKDPLLVKTYQEGLDIHRETAGFIFGLPQDQVTAEMRQAAKTINFGVIYGMSAFRLSNELSIPRKEAADFIDKYFSRFSGVKVLMDKVIAEAVETGSVTTLLGHRRYIPSVASKNKTEKMAGERIAFNTLIQGSAADIVKMAMLKLAARLKQEKLKTRLILQVHDELIVEAPLDEQVKVEAMMKEIMEEAVSLCVPMRVSVDSGSSWGDIH